jgi:hypothetical protein
LASFAQGLSAGYVTVSLDTLRLSRKEAYKDPAPRVIRNSKVATRFCHNPKSVACGQTRDRLPTAERQLTGGTTAVGYGQSTALPAAVHTSTCSAIARASSNDQACSNGSTTTRAAFTAHQTNTGGLFALVRGAR